VMVGVDTRQ